MAYLAAHLLNWLHNKQPNRSQGHTESFRDPLGASSYRKDTPHNRRNEVSSERITFCNNKTFCKFGYRICLRKWSATERSAASRCSNVCAILRKHLTPNRLGWILRQALPATKNDRRPSLLSARRWSVHCRAGWRTYTGRRSDAAEHKLQSRLKSKLNNSSIEKLRC